MKSINNFRMGIILILSFTITLFLSCSKDDNKSDSKDVTDIDGNVYATVKIGDQTWMKENLKVKHYRNGEPISQKNCETWGDDNEPSFCFVNDDLANEQIYGLFYNWYAVGDTRKIAPEGWHIPSDIEWQILIDEIGGEEIGGGKLKEKGYLHWDLPNEGATDDYGFTALPGGYFDLHSSLNCNEVTPGYYAYFWTSDENESDLGYAHIVGMYSDESYIFGPGSSYYKDGGCAIRCIKD